MIGDAQIEFTAAVVASRKEPDTLGGRLPTQHAHRDVGAFAGFCVLTFTNEWYSVYCRVEWVRYSQLSFAFDDDDTYGYEGLYRKLWLSLRKVISILII